MGAPGAGKSMQGKLLSERYDYAYLSTGELLRMLVTGRQRKEIQQGHLLSDSEIIRIVDTVMQLMEGDERCILDGFPRTQKQIDWLLQQCKAGRFSTPVVANLEISEATVRERLSARGRSDDSESVITRRFQIYQTKKRPMLDGLKQQGIRVVDIDANQTPEAVHQAIVAALGITAAEQE